MVQPPKTGVVRLEQVVLIAHGIAEASTFDRNSELWALALATSLIAQDGDSEGRLSTADRLTGGAARG